MSGHELKKKIRDLKLSSVPLDDVRKTRPSGLQGGGKWTGDDEVDRRRLLYEIEGFYDPQSLAFMVDILPYLFDALRSDDPSFSVEEPMSLLDIGSRTGVGANLLAQVFYGVWSRRKISVDVVDINPSFGEYMTATQPFIRRFICSDVADLDAASYDYVICSHVIEHVPDPVVFCDSLRRLARNRVIMYCPFEEYDPIPGHNTITKDLIMSLGGQDLVVSDKSWCWKREDRPEQKTAMFWLPGTKDPD